MNTALTLILSALIFPEYSVLEPQIESNVTQNQPVPIDKEIQEIDSIAELEKAHVRALRAVREAPAAVKSYQPKVVGDINNLTTDAESILKGLPFVKSVDVQKPAEKLTHRIIVVLDGEAPYSDVMLMNHTLKLNEVLEREGFEGFENLGQLEWSQEYDKFSWINRLNEEALFAEHLSVFRCLLHYHGMKAGYAQGKAKQAELIWDRAWVDMYHKRELKSKQSFTMENYLTENTGMLMSDAQNESEERSNFLLMYGLERAVVRSCGLFTELQARKELQSIYPVEDAEAFQNLDLDYRDGRFCYDPKGLKVCNDAMVRNMLKRDSVAIILLDDSRDLRENIRRIEPGAELLIVKVRAYSEITEGAVEKKKRR